MNKTKNETTKSEQKKQQKESVQHYESASGNEETHSITGGENTTEQQNHQPHYQRYQHYQQQQQRQYKHKKSSTNVTFTHQTLHTTAGAATQFSVQRSDVDGLRMKISAIRTPAVPANPTAITTTTTNTTTNTNTTITSTTIASIINATTHKRTTGATSSTSTSTSATTTTTSSTSSTSSSSSSSSITLSPNSNLNTTTKPIDKVNYNNNNSNSNNNNTKTATATTLTSTPSDFKTTSLKVKISNRQKQQQIESNMSVGMLINNSTQNFLSSTGNDVVSANNNNMQQTLHNINSNMPTTTTTSGAGAEITHNLMQNNTLNTTSAAAEAAAASSTTTKLKTAATLATSAALTASSTIPKSKTTLMRTQPCLSDATESGCSEATTITTTIYSIKDKQPTKKIKVKRKKAQSKQTDVKNKFNKKPRTQISTTSSSDTDDDEPLIKQQQHHHPHHHNHQNSHHHLQHHQHNHQQQQQQQQQQRAPRLLLTAINSKSSSLQLKAFTTISTLTPTPTVASSNCIAAANISTTAATIAATNTATDSLTTPMHSTDHIGLSSSDNELPDLVNAAIKRVESDSDDTVGGDSSYRRGKTKNLPQYQSTLLQDFMEKSQMLGQTTAHINNDTTSTLKSTTSLPALTLGSTTAVTVTATATANKSLSNRAELLANSNTNSQTESIASSTGACGTASVSGSISAANSVTTTKHKNTNTNNKKTTAKTIAGSSAKKKRGRPKKPAEEVTNTVASAAATISTAIEIDTTNRGLAAVAANINESADSGVISTASTTQSTTPSPRMPTTTGTPTRSTRKSEAKLIANSIAIAQQSPSKSISGFDASNSNTSNTTITTAATATNKPKIDIAYLDKRMYATERVLYPPPRNKRRQSLKLTSNSTAVAQSTSNANNKTTKEEIQLDPVWRKIDVNKKFRRPSLSGYKSDGGGGNTTICSKVLAAKSGYVSDYGSFHPRSNRHHNASTSGYKSDASCKSRYSMRSCVSRRSRAKSCGYRSDCKDSANILLKSAKYRRKRRASMLMHAPHMPHTAKSVVDLSDVQDILQLAGLSLGQSSEESNEYVCKPSLASLPTTSASKKYGEINRFIATGEYFGRGSTSNSGTHLSGQQGKRSYDLGNEDASQDGYSAAAFSGKILLQRKNSHISDIATDLLVPHAGTLRKIKSRRSSVASYCSSFYSGTSKVRRRRRRKSFRFPNASSGKNAIIDSKLLTDIEIITSTFHNLCSLSNGSVSGGAGNGISGIGAVAGASGGAAAGAGACASLGAGGSTPSTGERVCNNVQSSIGTLSGKEKLIAEANKLQQSLSIAVASNIATTATTTAPAVTASAVGSSLIGASTIIAAGVGIGIGVGVGVGVGVGNKGRDKRALKKRKVNENLVDFAMLSASAAAAQTPSSGSTKRRHKKANSSSPDDHKLPLKKRHYLLTPGEKPIEATLSMSAKMYANSTEAWAAAAAAAKTTASTKSQQQFNAQKTAKSGITPKKRHLLHNAIVAAPYLLEETPSIKSNKSSKSSNSSPLRIVVDATCNSISGGKLLDISPISLSSLKQQTDAKKRTRLEGLVTKIAHEGVTTTTSISTTTIINTSNNKDGAKPNTKSIIGAPQIDAETSCPPPGVFEPSVELEIQIPPIAKLTETAASIITKSEVDSPLLGLELPNACTKTEGARVVETLLNKTGGNLILKRKRKKINRTGFPTVRRKKRKINENLLLDVTPDLLANVPKVLPKTPPPATTTKSTKSSERCKSVGTMTTNERSSVCDRVPQTGETSDTFLERANRTPRLSVVALERLQGTPTATATATLRATPTAASTNATPSASTPCTTTKAGSSTKGSSDRQTPVIKQKSRRQKANSASNRSNVKNCTPEQESQQLPEMQLQQKTPVGRPAVAGKKSKLLRTEAAEEKPEKSATTKPIKIANNIRVSGRKSKATAAAAAAAVASIQEVERPSPMLSSAVVQTAAAVITKTPTTKAKKSARQNAAAAARETPTTKASSASAAAAATTPSQTTASAKTSATPTKATTKTRRKSPILTARALQAKVKLPAGIDPNTNFSCKIRLKRRNTLHPLALNNEQSGKCNSPAPPEVIEAEAAAKATEDMPIEHDILPLSDGTLIDPEATTSDTSDEKSSSASTSHNNVPRKQGRWRKNYLPAGLFSDYFKITQPSKQSKKNAAAAAAAAAASNGSIASIASTTPSEKQDAVTTVTGANSDNGNTVKSLLPPPPYCEKYFRRTQRDFELPYDIWWAYKNAKLPTRNTVPSWNYRKIRTNIYADSVRPNTAGLDHPMCNCKSDTGCTDNCLNRMVYTECSPSNCPTRDKCHNQKIQRHEVAPGVERFMTEDKGWGVRTKMPIKKGTYILEYVGEVVTEREFKDRMGTIYRNDTHHYCLHLDGGLVIDGHRMGSDGRFVNHSCEPNCEMQKWSVNGLSRMALFAKRHIEADEELTYDYNFALFNPAEGQPCFCKTSQCRGVIGGKSQRIKPLPCDQKPAEATLKDGRNKRQRKHKASKNAQPQRQPSKDVAVAQVQQMTEREKKLVKQTGIFMLRTFEKIRRCNTKRLERTASNSQSNTTTTSTSATNSNVALKLNSSSSSSGTTTATTPTSHTPNGATNSSNHATVLTITNRRPSTPASLAAQISALCTPRSIKTRGLSLAVQDPELEKMAKMAVILRDICTTLETLKMENDETKSLAAILQTNSSTNGGNSNGGSITSSNSSSITTTTSTTATSTCNMGKKKKMLKAAAAAAAQAQKQNANNLKSVQANIEQGFYKQPIDFDADMQQVFHELRSSIQDGDVDKQQALDALMLAYDSQKQQHYGQLLQLIGDEKMLQGFCEHAKAKHQQKQQQQQPEGAILNGVLQEEMATVSSGNGNDCRNPSVDGNGSGGVIDNNTDNGSASASGNVNGNGNSNGSDDGHKDQSLSNASVNSTTNSEVTKTATTKTTATEAPTTTTTITNDTSSSVTDTTPKPTVSEPTQTSIMSAAVPLPGPLPPASSNANSTEDIIRCICGLYKDEGLMIQCAQCMVWQHTECTKADIDADHYLCECCEPRNVDREIPLDDHTEDGHRYYLSLMRGQLQVRQGDAVYVLRDIPIKDATGKEVMKHTYETIGNIDYNECDIFRVERLWKTEAGKRFIFGHHFLRPHETFHEPTRRFYPNEVVRVPLYEVVPIELVIGRCWVLDRTTFCKGRPIECTLEEHCYICELRVDKTARFFSKAKINYPSCTKSYAFRKFPEKLRISKTYAPHVVDPAMLKKKHRNSTNDSIISSAASTTATTTATTATSLINTTGTHTSTPTTTTITTTPTTTKQEQTKATQQHGRKLNKNSNNPIATTSQLGIAPSATVPTQSTVQTTKEKRSHLENVLRTLKLQKQINNPQLTAEPAVDLTYLLTGRGARQRKHHAVNINTLITTTTTTSTSTALTSTSSATLTTTTTTTTKTTENSTTAMAMAGRRATATTTGTTTTTGSTTSAGTAGAAAVTTQTKQTTHTTHTIATFSSTITTGTSNMKTTTTIA